MGGTRVKINHDDSATAQTVQVILERAVKAGAHDVHLEPRGSYGVVRQRVNGALQLVTKLPSPAYQKLIDHLKEIGHITDNPDEALRLGKARVTIGRQGYDVEFATLPVVDGEGLNVHIAPADAVPPTLEELGYWGPSLKRLQRAISQAHGLVLVGSPDQPSTQATLASMLQTLSSPTASIAAVETTSPFPFTYIRQTTVRPNLGWNTVKRLREAVRRHADVVMVSEIPDRETVQLALEAAHKQLILAGFHSRQAAQALYGLIATVAKSELVFPTTQAVVGQHMVAQLCPQCRDPYIPNASLSKQLAESFRITSTSRMQRLHELEQVALWAGLGETTPLGTSEQEFAKLYKASKLGCPTCEHTGYQGRITINEVLRPGDQLQAVLRQAQFSVRDIRRAAINDGMIPLPFDALIKSLRGLVPIETALSFANL